jgi:radical SAM superfamily enzyme YgiQ (UPF0313 family)
MSVQRYWVFGLPGETVASALRSIELMRDWIARELVDAVHITVAVPYPGRPLGENPGAYGVRIVDRNFDNYWDGERRPRHRAAGHRAPGPDSRAPLHVLAARLRHGRRRVRETLYKTHGRQRSREQPRQGDGRQ